MPIQGAQLTFDGNSSGGETPHGTCQDGSDGGDACCDASLKGRRSPMDEVDPTGGPRDGLPVPRAVALRRAMYLMIAAGCLHAILFLAALWLLSAGPGAKASDIQILASYH